MELDLENLQKGDIIVYKHGRITAKFRISRRTKDFYTFETIEKKYITTDMQEWLEQRFNYDHIDYWRKLDRFERTQRLLKRIDEI